MHKSVFIFVLLASSLVILGVVIPFFNLNNVANADRAPPLPEGPIIKDSNLKAEVVFEGLASPTSIAFVGPNDILVLEKDKGTVQRIVNGKILAEPLLDVNVAKDANRGMLGIAVSKGEEINSTNIFLYFTEAPLDKFPIGNRVYKYELVNNKLVNPQVLLNLPALPGPSHNGGAIRIGPDNNIYAIIGDVGGHRTQAQNQESGGEPDGTSGVLMITKDGIPVANSPLGDRVPLNLYYSYGLRNSFGIDFDPITGKLWDTENGEDFGDEINLVEPGFNSGWSKVQGTWTLDEGEEGMTEAAPLNPENGLVDFEGKGKYSSPEFTWRESLGPSAIKFLNSDRLGIQYENDIFVGDIDNGNLYHFDLNKDRTALVLEGPLADKLADSDNENEGIIFGQGFGAITDIEVGPDGYLYIVGIQGTIYRIVPNQA